MTEHKDTDISSFTVEEHEHGDISVYFHGTDVVSVHTEDGNSIHIDREGYYTISKFGKDVKNGRLG